MNGQIVWQECEVVVFVAADVEDGGGHVQVVPWSRRTARDVGELVHLEPAVLPAPPERDRVHDEAGVHGRAGEDAPGA